MTPPATTTRTPPTATTAPPARPAPARPSPARDRLLRAASALFYAEGLRGVGVDRVIAQASVTRATFYRHFPSKEALVVAYLDGVDRTTRERAGGLPADPADAVGAARWLTHLTAQLADQLCAPGFRGCAFINAAAEYPDPTSGVRTAILAHREWLEVSVTQALSRAGHPDPADACRRWTALRDGAMVAAYLGDPAAARTTLIGAVQDLLTRPPGRSAPWWDPGPTGA
ncbi:TetR/AcrR family transcriptional regulator [Pengzhenrongella sicca]|uniref:TetR/AcrR family transcriptional regulator n=1 Tax=Pengzhenrongella sicca TaxID=2819238 RepID=A0A8A4ZHY4_9MICO|nr:TetR/AcrR family transcriptional regulator [Pengzhenrongella sicca]QTE30136.1 TetR/AcrR family transcriptional regulator [Pengzhenrongella sicca]